MNKKEERKFHIEMDNRDSIFNKNSILNKDNIVSMNNMFNKLCKNECYEDIDLNRKINLLINDTNNNRNGENIGNNNNINTNNITTTNNINTNNTNININTPNITNNNSNTQICFTLTNITGKIRGYTKDHYCIKYGISHLYIYYSVLEGMWVFYLHNGWIKINDKVLGTDPIYHKKECILDFEKEIYKFQSYIQEDDSTSKILSEAISASDDKSITKSHALYFLSTIKKIQDVSLYYKILLHNPIFEEEPEKLKINYYEYGKCRFKSLYYVLYHECLIKIQNTHFEVLDLYRDFIENIKAWDCCGNIDYYIVGSTVYYYKDIIDIVKYIYLHLSYVYNEIEGVNKDNKGTINGKDKRGTTNNINDNKDVSIFNIPDSYYTDIEIYKLWIQSYYKFKNPLNTKKRPLEILEDIIKKKRCVHRDDNLEQVCSTVVYKEIKVLRNCFTGIGTKDVKNNKGNKRSYSLIYDKDEGRDKLWMFNRRSWDI